MTTFTSLMNYKNFTDAFSKINDFPLPGLKAQLLAAPSDRRDKINSIKGLVKSAKKAAVLLYCYPKSDMMHLSLIRRTNYIGVHSGQISFPGGKPEPQDEKLEITALRESNEELGVRILNDNLVSLTPIYIPPSNFLVTPYLTFDNFYPNFKLDKREVADHIQLPLFKLLELEIEKRFLDEGPQKGIEVPCFYYDNNLIWGATAMILSEFKIFLTSISSN